MTAITWAHADQKLFVATKNVLHTITIHRSVPSLQALCNLAISSTLSNREFSYDLMLPTRLRATVMCVCLYVGVFRYLFCILVGRHELLVLLKLCTHTHPHTHTHTPHMHTHTTHTYTLMHTHTHTHTHTQALCCICPGCVDVVMMY